MAAPLKPGYTVSVVGIRATVEDFERRGVRAGNLLPIWPEAIRILEESEARRFAGNGYGWAPLSQASEKRRGDHPILRLTGSLEASLTESGAPGARRLMSKDTLVFGINGSGPTFYGRFHQSGTVHMPQRTILRVTQTVREKVNLLIAGWVRYGKKGL